MFGFDMLVHGVRGFLLPEEELNEEELEVHGVDWEGLQDERLLRSQRDNNPQGESWSSWVGRTGPPEHLNEVSVEPPSGGLLPEEVNLLDQTLQPWMHDAGVSQFIALWTQALANARVMSFNLF
jgi:hypothetical protein